MNARHDVLLALASSVPWPVMPSIDLRLAAHDMPPDPPVAPPAPPAPPAGEPPIQDPPSPEQTPPVSDPPRSALV